MDNLFSALHKYYEEMVSIRRYLHENPELSFQEVHTPAYIANYHRDLGLEVREGVGGRGVVAVDQEVAVHLADLRAANHEAAAAGGTTSSKCR